MLLRGQGEIHLKLAVERLKSRFNVEVDAARPQTGYKETIRKATKQHSRFKRQTGGHGQFGDVHVEIRPLPRGKGRSEEHTSELQSLMRISYAVFCLTTKKYT